MNTSAFFEALVPAWRASLPPTIDHAYFDAFVSRNRNQLEATLAPLVALLDAPTPQQSREAAAEEAHMGAALRAARDDEEAAWDNALRRGIAFEMTENSLDRDTARRIATRNLAADLHFYDQRQPKPADGRTKSERTAANLAAMQLVVKKEPGKFTASEITTLLGYSGWGGLSIDAVRSKFPPGLVPETFDLIHAYYTPTILADAIADAVCPLLPALASITGVVRALEPSAGIGRLIRAFSAQRCAPLRGTEQALALRWTAIEFSSVSSKLLGAVRPDIELYPMPLERWIADAGSRQQGTFNLIVSNPPYGERGAAALEDTDTFYKENRAYVYFMRRTLDLLTAGGLGVFLVPAGFLTGNGNRGVREKLLLRHHLSAAFRLPSQTSSGRDFVPGANVVMDLLFWRSRGGELTEVDADDQFIVDGDYFERFPAHILGTVDGESNGEEEAGVARKGRWRYSVTGDFKGLPPLIERPLCKACALGPIIHHEATPFESVVASTDEPVPEDTSEPQRAALALGRRVGRYLASVGDEKAAELWPELHAALLDFTRTPALAEAGGNPWGWMPLRSLADKKKLTAAQQLLSAFTKKGNLIPALAEPPKFEPRYQGRPDDVVAQAELLFRTNRGLTIEQLLEFHTKVGGTLARPDMLAQLYAAEWNRDGHDLYPLAAYTTGNDLLERLDRAEARAARGDEQAAVQVRRLLDAIKPAVFEDISDLNPQHGWMPLDLVGEWVSDTLNVKFGPVAFERAEGLVQTRGRSYLGLGDDSRGLTASTIAFLGYLNHDPEMFKPPRPRREKGEPPLSKEERAARKRSIAEERDKIAAEWTRSFVAWVSADEARRKRLTDAYNRSFRGRVVPTYSPEPLDIVRWGPNAPSLRPHQISGARQICTFLRGLLAFDVGVGKTYTALAVIAYARQKGWVRRPVILVPSSLVWKWHDDILCTLPDYRVLVIGSKRKRITRGERKGLVTSETDTPEERAAKWVAFQTGQADVVVLSFDALGRTKMSQDAVVEYINNVEAVRRSINLRRRNLQDQKADKLSERDKALLEHGVAAWVTETLKLPKGHQYDPGILWDDIGIDMLVVDEAAAFKNLYMPQAREDGVPKFMGSSGEGSHRAWQLDFRAAAVRKRTGGSGIVLLTATPAKNSPLEFYNILQFIDPTLFTRSGIHDPEQFIDRFLRIERRDVLDSSFNVTEKSAVVGFKNLGDLRTLIYMIGKFLNATEAGLKLPRPISKIVTVTLDDEQEDKYSAYVAEIEDMLEHPDPNGRSGNRILGLLARLSLIALHAQLDEGYTYKTALAGGTSQRSVPEEQVGIWAERGWTVRSEADEDGFVIIERTLPRPANYASPKFIECARRIAATPHCGHVIFCEPTATHQWIRETLVAHGIPRDRIAILNAETAAPADRVRIAREFNGLASEPPAPGTCGGSSETTITPLYDVLIVNSVANEGIDLQRRTCMLHHIDMPWTSADLEQRNGRGVRQGNTLGTVNIFYYFADRSMDGYRFDLINGKATWLADLLKSQARDTNNPAAQQQLTPEDILLMISRDKEKTQRMLDEKKKRKIAETRAIVAKEAARLLRQANGRFRDARASQSPERAAKLREEGEARLEELAKVDPEAWPWRAWMYAVRDTELIIPEDGSAFVYEGLRVARPRPGAAGQFEHLEFGRVLATSTGERIGLRAAGSPTWELVSGLVLSPEHFPHDGGPTWPDDDATTAAALDAKIDATFRYARGDLEALGWRAAADAWVDHHWPRVRAGILAGLTQSESTGLLPTVVAGKLVLAKSEDLKGELLPPSTTGWQRYLELAPTSGLKFTALKEAGEEWWERRIPNNLLSAEATPSATTELSRPVPEVTTPPAAEPAVQAPEPEAAPIPAQPPPEEPPEPIHEPPPAPVAAPATRTRRSHFPPGLSME